MEKRGKNKKAQFFIIAALIAVLVIFSFIGFVTYKKLVKPEKFYDLGKNFKFEVAEIIAKGKLAELQQGSQINIIEYLDNITHEYLKYSITQDPNIEIIYIYGNKDNITVYNFANEEACVYIGGLCQEVEGGRKKISSTLSLGDIKTEVVSPLGSYRSALNYIRQTFSPSGQEVTIEIGNVNYTFELSENEQFYLILKTKKGNETLVAKE